tara:strand:- start:698 stop:973 length:276 start_codon:yes stop_codon:yes gene_type:complete
MSNTDRGDGIMSKRLRDKSDNVSIDLRDLIHPSLRVGDHGGGDREVKPIRLSSGCILYGYDVFTAYRIGCVKKSTDELVAINIYGWIIKDG